MSAMSDYLEVALANHVLGAQVYSKPGTVYIALFTGSPSDGGGGSEVGSYNTGYARASVTNNATNWPNANATTGVKSNGTIFNFPTATGDWGTVTHFAIFDASSGGYMLYYGALSASRIINAGDTARFSAGDLTVTLTSGSDYFDAKAGDFILGGGTFSPSATVYIGLHTANPTEDGLTGEVSGGSYARVALANNTTNWPGATSGIGVKQNGTAIVFATASDSWGTVSHFSIWTSASGGNLLFQGALDVSRVIGNGDTPRFLTGALQITFA